MDAAVKAKWLEALRSGEYKQTTKVLTSVADDGSKSYCCLGVLCEVAMKNGLDLDTVQIARSTGEWAVEYNQEASTLPDKVQEWSGLGDDVGALPMNIKAKDGSEGRYHGALAELNDNGFTFAEIAGIIEREF